ncbi:MAG: hypothetical protein GXC75_04265 [Xanthomonadaceae bacterium]|nr:hypothetical protein [Xanthomonadaceae bacterium]
MSSTLVFSCAAVLAALVGLVLLRASSRRRVQVARWVGVLWLAYAAYEAAVQVFTPEADIRADLLLFYPILLLGAFWAVAALARHGKRAGEST